MTAAQDQALKRIMEISREHFDASVFVAMGDVTAEEGESEGVNPDKVNDHQFVYHGGAAASIGLLEMAKIHIWKNGANESEPLK